MDDTEKFCKRCGHYRSISLFAKYNNGVLSAYCEQCREYGKTHYRLNREKYLRQISETNRKRRGQLQREYAEYKASKVCLICGESDPICLVFHHVNPDDKVTTIASLALKGGSMKKILEEAEKCVVLCSNCHKKVHANILHLDA
jgi:transcription elongation factor Elf1